jgi:hypothetical protein
MTQCHFDDWYVRLTAASQPQANVAMRVAVLQSIRASMLLQSDTFMKLMSLFEKDTTTNNTNHFISDIVFGVWFLCFKLVLDDDSEVRDLAASVLHESSSGISSSSSSSLNNLRHNHRPCNIVVLELAMNFLTRLVITLNSSSNNSGAGGVKSLTCMYENHLYQMWKSVCTFTIDEPHLLKEDLLDLSNVLFSRASQRRQGGDEDDDNDDAENRKPIFEPEEDNMYCESILVVQLVGKQFHLLWENISIDPTSSGVSDAVTHTSGEMGGSVVVGRRHLLNSFQIKDLLMKVALTTIKKYHDFFFFDFEVDTNSSSSNNVTTTTTNTDESIVQSTASVVRFRELYSSLVGVVIVATQGGGGGDSRDAYFSVLKKMAVSKLAHQSNACVVLDDVLTDISSDVDVRSVLSSYFFLLTAASP